MSVKAETWMCSGFQGVSDGTKLMLLAESPNVASSPAAFPLPSALGLYVLCAASRFSGMQTRPFGFRSKGTRKEFVHNRAVNHEKISSRRSCDRRDVEVDG